MLATAVVLPAASAIRIASFIECLSYHSLALQSVQGVHARFWRRREFQQLTQSGRAVSHLRFRACKAHARSCV